MSNHWIDEELHISDEELISDIAEDAKRLHHQLEELLNNTPDWISEDKDKMFSLVESKAILEKLHLSLITR